MNKYRISGQHFVAVPFDIIVWAPDETAARWYIGECAEELDIFDQLVETKIETLVRLEEDPDDPA